MKILKVIYEDGSECSLDVIPEKKYPKMYKQKGVYKVEKKNSIVVTTSELETAIKEFIEEDWSGCRITEWVDGKCGGYERFSFLKLENKKETFEEVVNRFSDEVEMYIMRSMVF